LQNCEKLPTIGSRRR